ncbi:MAG TPA: family 43 glycosylhydrolase [Acidobacteriaceae bacterium]|nr:family 43 glycosylhydrolase [Acidobacteriaceae bacterium]
MEEKFELNAEGVSGLSRRGFVWLGGAAVAASGLVRPGLLEALAAEAAPRGTYVNPVIRGDRPDAGALRVGDDYYLTHTTDRHTPGLLLWHSRDLVHWKAVGAAVDEYIGAIWAPYLCEHTGTFYIYFPCDGKLMVVHAEHPKGPWSKPIPLGVGGIDPGHIATPEGRRYLYMAGGQMMELAADGLSVIAKPKHVVDTWPIPESWSVECDCQEAPKLFYRDGYYYLTVAEGGTSGPPTSHMVLSARSKSAEGPWEWSPLNPIVHTASAEEKWWSKGHGRPLEAADGSWWMTLHSYENGYRTLGRQVLLLPVEWTKDGWYRVPAGVLGGDPIRKKVLEPAAADEFNFAGNAPAGAASTGLDVRWQFWKGYDAGRVRLADGTLTLKADGDSIATTSLLTRAAVDHVYTVEVDVEIDAGCEAGLLLFYNSDQVVGLRLNADQHASRAGKATTLVHGTRATLRIVNDDQVANFFYRLEGGADAAAQGPAKWTHVRRSLDVSCYNHNALGGFLDLRPALYACGAGSATFRNWRYVPSALDMA